MQVFRRTVFHARVEPCPSFSTAGRDVCLFNIRGTAFLWHQVWVWEHVAHLTMLCTCRRSVMTRSGMRALLKALQYGCRAT